MWPALLRDVLHEEAAVTLGAVLLVLLLYRHLMRSKSVQRALHQKCGSTGALVLQYYAVLLLVLLLWWLEQTVDHFFNASHMRPHRLTHKQMRQHLNQTLRGTYGMEPAEADRWLRELHVDPQLEALALSSPGAAILAWCVCAAHVRRLVAENVNGLEWYPSYRQDLVMQVILLPAVYATLSFRNVIRLWSLMIGNLWMMNDPGRLSWSEVVDFNMDVYSDNFAVANLAEMYTVWCFSQLCMDLLKDFIWAKDLRVTLSRVTMQGVHIFLVVGVTKVVCQLWLHYLKIQSSAGNVHHADMRSCTALSASWASDLTNIVAVNKFLSALLAVASMQCLYNIMMICWMPQLKEINPGIKFLGTRILIIFAQLQSAALEFMADNISWFKYSACQVRLLHASLMCFECLAVAFLHFCSWPPEDYEQGYLPLDGPSCSEDDE